MESEMAIKEEQLDIPPGFTLQPEMSYGGAFTSPLSAATLDGGDQPDGPNPIEMNLVPMQNSMEYFMQQCSSSVNSAENSGKRKRKPKEFPGYETLPLPGRRRPRALPPPQQAYESDSQLIDFNPTIDAIKAKHGDIDKDCNLKSLWMRKLNLFGICNVVKELQMKRLDELDIVSLELYYDVVRDMETLNINVKWLLERLDQIKEAIISRYEAKVLNDEKNERMKNLEEKRKEVGRLKNEIENLENQMALESLMIEQLSGEISTRTSKFRQFQHGRLTDGLI
ncbi:hypothetical protein Pfo_010368 [Paulownia fortunei]|nr:hypothetical protein Pfo_010368 [Paulownia fortunei]